MIGMSALATLAAAAAAAAAVAAGKGDGGTEVDVNRASAAYPAVPPFKAWFTPGYHMAESGGGRTMQDPAGNIQLADGTVRDRPSWHWHCSNA